jgi:coenzyme F420 hydrogenase subunit beta
MSALGTISTAQVPSVVKNGQCIGCGFCQIDVARSEPNARIDMTFSTEEEIWTPSLTGPINEAAAGLHVCPGAKMDMQEVAQAVFNRQPDDALVGESLLITAGYAHDPSVRQAAASGGVTTALLDYLFARGEIDVAYCSAGRDPKHGKAVLARSSDEIRQTMGSHYHPINFGSQLPALIHSEDRFAFVGLPCEIAAMREMMIARPDVRDRCVALIGLFCGGINRFSGIGKYLENFGTDPKAVDDIDYRDGAWPGQIRLTTTDGAAPKIIPRIMNNSRWNILRYVISFQGYWMLPRCRICPDQIADFADIAVGDPHLPRFKSHGSPGYSAVIARTNKGLEIVNGAVETNAIVLEPLSRDELVKSQGYTLENRRQALLYSKVASLLGMKPPVISIYKGLNSHKTWHQYVYAFVDLIKIKVRRRKWLRPFYMPLQIFEYLFLTFSVRVLLNRLGKLARGK